jgi:tetratricopeptide (TPR) repeat protein
VGPDTFGLRFPYERPARAGHRVLVVADEAHDVYLDRAATSGLPALAAYLWLVGTMAVIAWRGRRIVAPEHRWLLAAFGGAFAGYLGQGAFSIDMVPLAWWSWVCLGAIVALTDPAVPARAAETPAPVGRPLAAPALAGLVLATLVGLGLAVRPVLADREARAGQVATRADRPLDAYAAFARASGWLDHEPRYHERQAAALVRAAAAEGVDPDLRRTLLDEAQVAYDQALDRAPDDAVLLQAQAQTHLLAAEASEDPSVAAEHVDAAIGIGRKLVRSTRATDALHLDLGRAYEARAGLASGADAQRDRDRAEEQYEAALAYVPDHVTALEGLARLAIAEDRLTDARRLLVRAQRAHHDPRVEAAIEELDRRIDAEG